MFTKVNNFFIQKRLFDQNSFIRILNLFDIEEKCIDQVIDSDKKIYKLIFIYIKSHLYLSLIKYFVRIFIRLLQTSKDLKSYIYGFSNKF